jgi:hypothetical protein
MKVLPLSVGPILFAMISKPAARCCRMIGNLVYQRAKNIGILSVVGLALMGMTLFGAEAVKRPQINWDPFEPPASEFFNKGDKFAHPPEIIAPSFLWPFEMRRGMVWGETIALVQIDRDGYPQKISVLSSTDTLFTRSTIFGLEKARWKAGIGDVWFYYKAVFDPKKMLSGH